MTRDRYRHLGLLDNPFPRVPTVDTTSVDVRMNGSIYNDEVFSEQLSALRTRLERHDNVIYAQNTKFVAGVGKSALIAREWRRLQSLAPETTVFIRCGRKTEASTVDGACNAIVDRLTRQGAAWKAFCSILIRYVSEATNPLIEQGIVDNLVARYPQAPRTIAPRSLLLWDVRGAIESISDWVQSVAPRVWQDGLRVFLTMMFSYPTRFAEEYLKKAKRKEVMAFVTIVELIRLGNVGYLYVFLNQFEELFHGRAPKEVLELSSSMRQMLEASTNLATFVVTLHPSAAMQIRSADAQSLTTIAPVDDRHVVDMPNIQPSQAIAIAETYLSCFRADTPAEATAAPFTEECVRAISESSDGNIREILQTMHHCIEAAVDHGVSEIDTKFFQDQYREITGRVSEQDLEL